MSASCGAVGALQVFRSACVRYPEKKSTTTTSSPSLTNLETTRESRASCTLRRWEVLPLVRFSFCFLWCFLCPLILVYSLVLTEYSHRRCFFQQSLTTHCAPDCISSRASFLLPTFSPPSQHLFRPVPAVVHFASLFELRQASPPTAVELRRTPRTS